MRIEVIDESAVTPDLDTAIRRTLVVCFPHSAGVFGQSRCWRGNRPLWSIVARAGVVAAHVAVIDRTIRVGEETVRVAGVGNVCALPEYRKTGLIDKVLASAAQETRRRGFDLGLLFCREPVKEVYFRNGWIEAAGRAFVRVENGIETEMPPENLRLYLPLRLSGLPAGRVHLQGDRW